MKNQPQSNEPDRPRLISKDDISTMMHTFRALTKGDDNPCETSMASWWNGGLRWARNRITLASELENREWMIQRTHTWGRASGMTNQMDDSSVNGLLQVTGWRAAGDRLPWIERKFLDYTKPTLETPRTVIWSNVTYSIPAAERSRLARLLVSKAEPHGVLSAGYIETRAVSTAVLLHDSDEILYQEYTQAQCSVTVRDSKGNGSGWAGLSSYDWSTIDCVKLADTAIEKCLASLNAVRIEPGRYTAILEPQAVCDFLDVMMGRDGDLDPTPLRWQPSGGKFIAEQGKGPFVLGYDAGIEKWRSKIGLKVADERVTLKHDPLDTQLGVKSKPGLGPVTWIERGVLKTLNEGSDTDSGRLYSLSELNKNTPSLYRPSYRMDGGPTSLNEMIQTTKRGILISRFHNLQILDTTSLLATGVTRDGLWLIEDGKISRSIKNMRITESPLFMLNQIDQIGSAVPVFRPCKELNWLAYRAGLMPAIVPTLKVNDFSFTATIDAI